TLDLFALSMRKYGESWPGRSAEAPLPCSPRPGCSILITSAPSHASICVQAVPASNCVRSTTRTPSSDGGSARPRRAERAAGSTPVTCPPCSFASCQATRDRDDLSTPCGRAERNQGVTMSMESRKVVIVRGTTQEGVFGDAVEPSQVADRQRRARAERH